jgi:type IV pilus assembly protein PilE
MFRRVAKGFTLIELMIVVAVIAILASLAYYNYGRYAFRTRRADAREMLMRIAAAQERYYTNFNAYATSVTAAPPAGLGITDATSEHGYYTITTANGASGDAQSYVLTATPVSGQAQASDACGALTLDNLGNKSQTGNESNGSCW